MLKKIKNDFIYVTISLLIFVFRIIPRSAVIVCLKNIGLLAYYMIYPERNKVKKNLELIYGGSWPDTEIHNVAKNVFINLGRNIVDVIRFKRQDMNKLFRRNVTCVGWEHFDSAQKRGKGIICFSGHMGAFELLHHYMAWRGYKICVTGAQIYDSRLNRLLIENRMGNRITYIERNRNTGREIIRHLHEGNLFGVLLDQDTRVEGVFAPFLGKSAYTPSTPVKIAMKTGAAIVPFVIRMDGYNRHYITIEPEIEMENTGNMEKDLIENVTRCNNIISKWITETPDQWVWMHDRWKTKEPGQAELTGKHA